MTACRRLAPEAAFDHRWLGVQLRDLGGSLRGRKVCVAYSGGLDSTALLCALAALRRLEPFRLRALHVNHQLQPRAAQWAREAQRTARRLRVRCEVMQVSVRRAAGESLEAAARAARYQALTSQLQPQEWLLTAHHQEDQLETVLLALMRGSGVRGLAAMRPVTRLGKVMLVRPLLPVARAQLERYLRKRALAWSEDPSNTDERFDRNYLRRTVVPLLKARWPAAAATVSRSAAHLSETRSLLERRGREQLREARDGRSLRASALRRLPLAERINALRVWFDERGLAAPGAARMREIAGPFLSAREDATPEVIWAGGRLRRHGDRVHVSPERLDDEGSTAIEVSQWHWRRQPWLSLGAAGSLGLVPDPHGDVRLAALPEVLSVRYRLGGERLPGRQGRSSLKDLLQHRRLAPWERAQVPLVMHEHTIVAVADLWLAAPFTGRGGRASGRGRFRWRHRGAAQAGLD